MREFAGYLQPDGRVTYIKYETTVAEINVVYMNRGSIRIPLWTVTGYDGTTSRAPSKRSAINLFLEARAA